MKIKLNKKEQIEVSVPASAWSGFKGTLIGMEVRGLEVYGYVLGKFPDSLKQRCYGGNIPPSVICPEQVHIIRLNKLKKNGEL